MPGAQLELPVLQPRPAVGQAIAQRGSVVRFLAWEARSVNDCKLVTRYPILGSWAVDGNLAVHLDTMADWGAQALVISAHLPCCQNNASRQAEIDHIMSFLRDAMTVGDGANIGGRRKLDNEAGGSRIRRLRDEGLIGAQL